ncbi:cytochrome P450 [Xylariales sp. PMI_506]|nr:cytochrome P450 [Xylariales sp. PMI_506]
MVVYNIFFHPLRRYPGPLLHRASKLPWALQQRLHERYGPVVRIAPGHLSFTDPRAWRDIYGHRAAGVPEFEKSAGFVRVFSDDPSEMRITNAGHQEHAALRRALSQGFSEASMRLQAPQIARYADFLIERLRGQCDSAGEAPLNLEAWYNWTTFDVIGDLVFGKPFGCLEKMEYHPLISIVFGTVKFGSIPTTLNYLGFRPLIKLLFRSGALASRAKTMKRYVAELMRHRLDMGKSRDDLIEGLVKRQDELNLGFGKLCGNAFILVLAGSETSATTLSGATYFLLKHPDIMKKLQEEVRSSFKSSDEIDITSVNKLSYMLAILNETLRMYPPLTSNLVRVIPYTGTTIADRVVPGGTLVECQHWSINHSKDNWAEPWTFNPERFLVDPGEAAERGNQLEALQAFSVGPRNCIGRNLAFAEMRLILAKMIYAFDMKLVDDSKDWIERQKSFTIWDRLPLNVYLTPVAPESR